MTREEFAGLALDHLAEVTAYARRLARNFADADDLVQATYERAFSRWNSLRDARACRAWLFCIVRNLHTDLARSAAARPELHSVDGPEPLPEPEISAETIERLDARQLDEALRRLPEDQREAVLLCDLWGFKYDEIAAIMSCPLGTVQSRIARGRSSLAKSLAVEGTSRGKGRVH